MVRIFSKHDKRQRVAWLLILIGAALVILAAFVYYKQTLSPQAPSGDNQTQAGQPSAVKPKRNEIDSYQVAPLLPRYISIPSIKVGKTRVIQLGLTKNNQIAVPSNIFDAGWYNNSSRPGDNGAMFIYGHVSSWQADGIFYNLNKLRPGDKIVVTRGDNKQYTYQVDSTKVYSHDSVDMKAVLSPVNSSRPGLNLMTCTGTVIKGTSEFSERLVVFTSLVNS